MEFSPTDKIKYKDLLLQTYKAFAKFCADNDIQYFAAGGTMIGAVRHKGFIPWDDDIDVYMNRSEYDKFISLRNRLAGSCYEIIDPSNKGYYCAMAKFSHRNSTIWEFQGIPFVFGAYIDVFVLDFEDGTYNEIAKKRRIYSKKVDLFYISANNHPFKVVRDLLCRGELMKSFWLIFQKLLLNNIHPLLKKYIVLHSGKREGEWLVAYTGTSGEKDIFRSEWFDGAISYQFEDTYINVPSGYDNFLTAMFGDYMTLPPIEEQKSHHALFYYNLYRRLSQKEIVGMQIDF